DTVVRQGIHQVVIGCMVGKLAKMAQGETLTHARRAEVDRDLLAELARECGAPAEVCEAIRQAETARYAAERLAELGLGQAFHQALAQRLVRTLAERYPGQFSLQVLVCDFEGDKLIAEAASAPAAHADEQGGTRRPHRLGSVAQPTDSPAPSPLAGEGWGEGSEGLHIDV
ncbi:MAG: hypothetical protein KBE53_05995, partial [Chromatiaceae bacterium]|nr:hypothetical protein [Chromatiaceae bacterium]